MGFHIYIKEVIEKPLLRPDAEQKAKKDQVSFYPEEFFTDDEFNLLAKLFPAEVCELFECGGVFLKECNGDADAPLPSIRVVSNETVFLRRDDFAAYLREEPSLKDTSPELIQRLLDSFIEGQHVAYIG